MGREKCVPALWALLREPVYRFAIKHQNSTLGEWYVMFIYYLNNRIPLSCMILNTSKHISPTPNYSNNSLLFSPSVSASKCKNDSNNQECDHDWCEYIHIIHTGIKTNNKYRPAAVSAPQSSTPSSTPANSTSQSSAVQNPQTPMQPASTS